MNSIMTQEDSYAERRKLFKNIWDTAMTLDEKEGIDVISKPKVIKTLRLDEVDRCVVGKKKKERLKNLRAVCNKLLDFCDRQDADDLFYEQMAAEGKMVPVPEPEPTIKKTKPKIKRKVIKSKSVFARVTKPTVPRVTTSERPGDFDRNVNVAVSRNNSPSKKHSCTFKTKLGNHHKLKRIKDDGTTSCRKVVKKKNSKKIKPSDPNCARPGKLKCKISPEIPIASKKILPIHKINIR